MGGYFPGPDTLPPRGHFGNLIAEASPLKAGPLLAFVGHFGGHFGELIVEASPLKAGPLLALVGHLWETLGS